MLAIALAAAMLPAGVAKPTQAGQPDFTPRFGAAAARANGLVCVFGGFDRDEAPLATVECFASAGPLEQRAAMPTARGLLAATAVGRAFYTIGGTLAGPDVLSAVERYDPRSDTWTPAAALPTPRNALSAVAVDGRIYAIGGWGVDDKLKARDFDTVEIYDPATGRWSAAAPMPTPRSHMAMAVANGEIYAIGGWVRRAGLETALAVVEIYNPATNRWSSASDLPTPRWLATAATVGGRIYVLGGWTAARDGTRTALTRVEVLDPTTGGWARDSELVRARAGQASALVGDKILLIGGVSTATRAGESSLLAVTDRYAPSEPGSLVAVEASERTGRAAPAPVSVAEFRDGGAYGLVLVAEEPFGNLRSNLVMADLERLGLRQGHSLLARIDGRTFAVVLGKDFSDVGRGEWVAFPELDGTITLARNFASAAEACGCGAGAALFVLPDRD